MEMAVQFPVPVRCGATEDIAKVVLILGLSIIINEHDTQTLHLVFLI
jgi:hypothetical protein